MKFALVLNKDRTIPDPEAPGYILDPKNPPVTYPAGTIVGFVDEAIVVVDDNKQIGDSI